jgi:hypothetical protein
MSLLKNFTNHGIMKEEKNNSALLSQIQYLSILRLILIIITLVIIGGHLPYAINKIGSMLWAVEFFFIFVEMTIAFCIIFPLHLSISRYKAFHQRGNQQDLAWGKRLMFISIGLLILTITLFFAITGIHAINWFFKHRLGF